VRLLVPRWSSVSAGRDEEKEGMGPAREVFVRERIWRDVRSGEGVEEEGVKKDKLEARG
jgi:hypothetical protein